MRSLISTLLLASVLALLVSARTASAGGASSGGGSVFYPRGSTKPVLLDLYLAHPGFEDTYDFNLAPRPQRDGRFRSRNFNAVFVDISGDAAYRFALRRLEAWHHSSPVVVKAIRKTMEHTVYLLTSLSLPATHCYVVPADFDTTRIKTAVYYTPAVGALFSEAIVSKLGDRSRAGLIVHEALRQIQLAYGNDPITRMSDETLQRVTAKIIFDEPGANETLDDPTLYGSYVEALSGATSEANQRKLNQLCRKLSFLRESLPMNTFLTHAESNYCHSQFARTATAEVPGASERWTEFFRRAYDGIHGNLDAFLLECDRTGHEALKAIYGELLQTALRYYIDAQNGSLAENTPVVYEASTRSSWISIEIDRSSGAVQLNNR